MSYFYFQILYTVEKMTAYEYVYEIFVYFDGAKAGPQ